MRYRHFVKASISTMTIALISLGLTGCKKDEEPVIVKSQEITEKFPALTDAQIDEVFTDTSAVIEAGDKEKDSGKLHSRVTDPALSLRAAQYTLAKKDKDFDVPSLPTQRGTVTLTASQDWPRFVVNIASKDEKSPTYIEIFKQDGARDKFKLSHWVRLFPKETVPPTAVTKKGAELIASDAEGYKMKPKEAVTFYGENLLNAQKLKESGFDIDALATALQSETKDYKEALGSHYNYTHATKAKEDIVSIALEDGGVLTFAIIDEHMGAERTNKDARMKLKGEIAALIGNEGKADKGFSADAKLIAAFVIPPKDSDQLIQVIGAERLFTSAKALE